jgi:uncharacterized membrane protein YqaE (UPF0057 family)
VLERLRVWLRAHPVVVDALVVLAASLFVALLLMLCGWVPGIDEMRCAR